MPIGLLMAGIAATNGVITIDAHIARLRITIMPNLFILFSPSSIFQHLKPREKLYLIFVEECSSARFYRKPNCPTLKC
jgi:hypothetical protein